MKLDLTYTFLAKVTRKILLGLIAPVPVRRLFGSADRNWGRLAGNAEPVFLGEAYGNATNQ